MLKFSRSLLKVRHYNSWQELASQTRTPSNYELNLKIRSMEISILTLKKNVDILKCIEDKRKQTNDTDTGTIEEVIENYWKIGG